VQKHTGASYDEIAQKYSDAQDTDPWSIYFERPGVLRLLPSLNGISVLDAGCGPGFYSQFMMEQGANVTACDLNPIFIQRTRERTNRRVEVHQADLTERLDFADDSTFDLVTCLLTLHYLQDWLPTLKEFHRVLRPGGQLIFSTHHPLLDIGMSLSGDYFAVEVVEDVWDVGPVQFYRRPISKIVQDLREAGFGIETISEPQPVKPPEGVAFPAYERTMVKPMRLLFVARRLSPNSAVPDGA
jgi:SAM-dependent methyltransferase